VLCCFTAAVSGCTGGETLARSAPTGARPALHSPAALLSGDLGEEAPLLEFPRLERWPRTMYLGGAMYAHVQLSPYVGQFGVLQEYELADAGAGFGVSAGMRFPAGSATALGVELLYERSAHTNAGADVAATATRLLGAARLGFNMDRKLSPFAVVGFGSYSLEFDRLDSQYDVAGPGLLMGGGVDYSPKPKFTIRAELGLHVWTATEQRSGGGTGGAQTLALGLGAAVSF
jgi:hypothetical protein